MMLLVLVVDCRLSVFEVVLLMMLVFCWLLVISFCCCPVVGWLNDW